jgi:hypothetical protein
VDAKWVTAILLLFLLSATFLTFTLVQITGEEQGIEILTVTLASSFSRNGLDQEQDIQIMHEKIAESPDGAWQPLPGLNISVREEDIAGLSPREIRLWFFRQLAEPIYHEGQAGLAKLATDPEMAKNMQGSLGVLGFISAETHARLNRILTVLGLISFALLSLLAYFSYRFGRLGSPGCVIFLSAVPGVAMFSMMRGWLERAGQNPGAETEATALTIYTQMAEKLAVDVLPAIVQKSLQTYLILTVIGLTLMLGAVLGGLIFRWREGWR